jgi:ribosomal protein S18 acetylase RimI-like enzyme
MNHSAVRRRTAVDRRDASAGDIALLRSLFADAHVELAVLPPDTRFVLVDMQFRAQRRQHATQYPAAQHDILLVDGTEVGRLMIDRSQGEYHIVDITVALGHRREGIAATVLADVVAEAAAAGQLVRLTIWSGNVAARQLCERVGLRVTADDDGYLTMSNASSASVTPAG